MLTNRVSFHSTDFPYERGRVNDDIQAFLDTRFHSTDFPYERGLNHWGPKQINVTATPVCFHSTDFPYERGLLDEIYDGQDLVFPFN